ncbi:hypothetical protein V6R21_02905 [Limibacter armeniacum]|uniref:hypothetical protein n=1 Tax=Limibacter armeniacum TaxID=466084 RepID=UPI002FE688BE
MKIEPFGNIKLNVKDNEWFGDVENICPHNKVELSICLQSTNQDLSQKIDLVKELASDYEKIVASLYDLAYQKYKNTEFEVTREEIEKMYFLSAVNLKEDNETWWLTMEPNFNVTPIYNHFLRFTMHRRKIIWANFEINITS